MKDSLEGMVDNEQSAEESEGNIKQNNLKGWMEQTGDFEEPIIKENY